MVYTEYFAQGDAADDVCPLHEPPSVLDRLAGVFGKDTRIPVASDPSVLPTPPPTSTSGNASVSDKDREKAAEEHTSEEPKKKRGFWSKVFGGGDKKSDEEKKKKKSGRKRGGRKEEKKRREERSGPGERFTDAFPRYRRPSSSLILLLPLSSASRCRQA